MTYAPTTLAATGRYWVAQGGRNLGIVGDTSHQAKGVSYHLGRDQLTAGAYSRQTTRDRAGLTDAASAIDLGRLNGTFRELRRFSVWLVEEARHNRPGTSDMREIIYSPDGDIVLRWDRQRGYASKPQGGEADTSHLTHTHISWYRDAEKRDHTTAFRPYFEEGDAMGIGVYLAATKDENPYDALGTATLSAGALQRVRDGVAVPLAAGTALGVVQLGTRVEDALPIVALNHAGELHIVARTEVTYTPLPSPGPGPTPPPDDTPYDERDLENARTEGAAAELERVAIAAGEDEADRIRAL